MTPIKPNLIPASQSHPSTNEPLKIAKLISQLLATLAPLIRDMQKDARHSHFSHEARLLTSAEGSQFYHRGKALSSTLSTVGAILGAPSPILNSVHSMASSVLDGQMTKEDAIRWLEQQHCSTSQELLRTLEETLNTMVSAQARV